LKPCDNFIGLYVGGVDIDDGAEALITSFVNTHKDREMVGVIELNGSRFTVKDLKNDHGSFNATRMNMR
jgi:hypothetical protein